MKKLVVFFSVLTLIALAGVAFAQDNVCPRPWAENRDVIYPDCAIKAGFAHESPANGPFYIAYDDNEWFVTDAEYQKYKPVLVRTKDGNWKAAGMRGQRHHPVILKDGSPIWLKIENVYNLPNQGTVRNGIDYTNPDGPCFLVE